MIVIVGVPVTSVESGGGTADEDRVGHQLLQTCGRLQDAGESVSVGLTRPSGSSSDMSAAYHF